MSFLKYVFLKFSLALTLILCFSQKLLKKLSQDFYTVDALTGCPWWALCCAVEAVWKPPWPLPTRCQKRFPVVTARHCRVPWGGEGGGPNQGPPALENHQASGLSVLVLVSSKEIYARPLIPAGPSSCWEGGAVKGSVSLGCSAVFV